MVPLPVPDAPGEQSVLFVVCSAGDSLELYPLLCLLLLPCTESLLSMNNIGWFRWGFFFFFFAKHIIVGLLFRNIHPSLQYFSHSCIHTSLYDFCSSHVHSAL